MTGPPDEKKPDMPPSTPGQVPEPPHPTVTTTSEYAKDTRPASPSGKDEQIIPPTATDKPVDPLIGWFALGRGVKPKKPFRRGRS